jgi:hypothetical protein
MQVKIILMRRIREAITQTATVQQKFQQEQVRIILMRSIR